MTSKQPRRSNKRKSVLKNFDFHLYGPIPRSIGISAVVLVCGIFGFIGYNRLQNSSAVTVEETDNIVAQTEEKRSNNELYVYVALALTAGSFLYWMYRQNEVKRY